MTYKDKRIVVDYMDWKLNARGFARDRNGTMEVHFDLNDVGLVVAEMQKRGEFIPFVNSVCYSRLNGYIRINFIAWLFNADNFFNAFVQWRKRNETY